MRDSPGQVPSLRPPSTTRSKATQARFQAAQDAHARVADFRTANDALGDDGVEQFGVIAFADGETGGGRAFDEFREGARRRVDAGKRVVAQLRIERGDHIAVPGGEKGKWMIAGLQPFQRRQRVAEPGNEVGGDVEFIVGNQPARIAAVKLVAVVAECGERLRKAVAARARARAAQQSAFESGDGDAVRALLGAKPQQWMLEQRQKRHRLEAAERGFRRQPCEHAGRRVGERVAGRVVDRDLPTRQRGGDAARQRAVGRHQGGGLARRFERFAQRDRDGERLFLGVGRLDHGERGERLVGRGGEVLLS